jgi:hypothetical protein
MGMRKSLTFLAVTALIGLASAANAQDAFSGLIRSSPADATKLFNAYSMPLFKGLGIDQNSGWNNTAKTKKTLRFDIRVTASAAFVSSADKTFDVTKIGMSDHVRPADASKTITPTFGGQKNIDGPVLNIYDDNGRKVSTFTMPAGVISFIPAPQIQATVGLIQNTDITLRAIPKITVGSDYGSISMIGIGLKHDIMQDIAGKTADKLIPFDLAIAIGYSHLKLDKTLTVNPDDGAQPKDSQQSTDFSNQHIDGSFNSFMAQVIISKKLPAFTPFLAVGYNTTHANVTAVGNYPVTTGGTLLGTTYTTFTNPISISESVVSGARADIGFQLNLGVFRFYTSYSLAQYSSVNAGIGLGI